MRKSRRKYLKIIRLVLLNSKNGTLRVTKRSISLQDSYRTEGSSRKIKRWTSNMYSHATIWQTCLQRFFLLQHSKNTCMVSECGICVTCEEKAMSIILRGRLRQCTFFFVMVFVPMNFSMTSFLTRHYVIQNG